MVANRYHKKILSIVFFIIISIIMIEGIWKFSLEQSVRRESNFNLQQIKMCTVLSYTSDMSNIKIHNNEKIREILYTCAKEIKLTKNSKIVAFDRRDKKIIFDSLDSNNFGKPIYKELCSTDDINTKKTDKKCNNYLQKMYQGINSNEYNNIIVNEIHNKYIEWMIVPSEYIGFGGRVKSSYDNIHQIVVISETNKDEVLHRYIVFRIILYVFGLLVIIILMAYDRHILQHNEESDAIQ